MISIALCTYNGERWLKEQLDSYVAQNRRPDELIVCDDGSDDGTVRLIEQFAATAPFAVELIVNERNLGSTRNFEKAISLCKGDLIFLSDQDDVWLPSKIGRIAQVFDKNDDVGLVFSDAALVDEDLKPLGKSLAALTFGPTTLNDLQCNRALETLLDQNFVTGATMAFRSTFRDSLVPTPEGVPNLIHDAWIALSIAACARIFFVDEPLIKYRQHAAQQVGLRISREEDRKELFEKTIKTLESEVGRLRAMQTILQDLPGSKTISVDKLIRKKLEYRDHCAVRINLPPGRAKRVGPIVKEMITGRYNRFSRGILSAVKDLSEPIDPVEPVP